MFRKIVTIVIVIPLAAVIVAFAVANRQMVTVSFDPFSSANPAYAATLPLFIMVFVLVILGVIVGGAASWLRQSKWRRAARKLDSENRVLQQELSTIRNRFGTDAQAAPAREAAPAPAPLPVIPPPAA
ncbi:MAG: LapA family protein [Pseudolabrys sp.]|nr:LapA family protein [Pseudolabrys sp.]